MNKIFIPGMVSVTFRRLNREKIVSLVKEAGLEAVEWGSDVHVPYADSNSAKEARLVCESNGIIPVSYGSYYCKGERGFDTFAKTIENAKLLGTNNIRIWASNKDSEDMPANEKTEFVKEAQTLADMAKKENIDISFECHKGTLTNTPNAAIRLVEEIARDNVYLYWQPLQSEDIDENKRIIKLFMPYLKNVHVYAWKELERFELNEHEKAWREYIELIGNDTRKHALLLEFVKDDSTEQFMRDAETLLSWIR